MLNPSTRRKNLNLFVAAPPFVTGGSTAANLHI
jgi:hypothetical protein